MPSVLAPLALLSALVNTVGQLCGIGGRPFLQVLFQAIFVDSLRTSSEVIATALLVNTIAFSLGVPGYGALGLYDPRLILEIATVSVPSAILGASAGALATDRALRLIYAVFAASAAAALATRAHRLAPRPRIQTANVLERAPLLTTSSSSENAALLRTPEVFSREGNFLPTDDVERLSMLDDSDSEEETDLDSKRPTQVMEGYQSHRQRMMDAFARGRHLISHSACTLASYASSAQSMLSPSADNSSLLPDTVADARSSWKPKVYPFAQVLSASVTSLTSLSSTAQSLISMSASATTNSLLPTSTRAEASSQETYGAVQPREYRSWPLLDLALARYERPALVPRDKAVLLVGGLLCGALGVGVPESVLIVLVGLHNVPLAAAATSAISVAFYAQMVASMMDAVATAADASAPRIAESVPWGLVGALLPGVVTGALVGPRLHAFVPERRMLSVASATLFLVSGAVAVVGSAL